MPFAAGQKLRASELRPPVCALRRNTAQSIASSVWTPIQWNSEVLDTDAMWSATANTNIVIPKTGYYLVAASVGYAGNTAGASRGVEFKVDGAIPDGCELVTHPQQSVTRITSAVLSQILPMTTGDILTVQAFQDSGVALNIGATAVYAPSVNVTFLRD